jgi:hypothetical protein
MKSDYFSERSVARAVMSWAEAVELQLDRWEALVAQFVLTKLAKEDLPAPVIWQTQFERHFCLIANANLVKALRLMGNPLRVEKEMANELVESRDLQEHWPENMPISCSYRGRPSRNSHPARGSLSATRSAAPMNGWSGEAARGRA